MSSLSTNHSGTHHTLHTRTPKSRSIGSLPLPLSSSHSLRLTPTESLATTSSLSSSIPTTPDMRGIRSPSRLPATDCLSYFPPFESMGSGSSSSSPSSSSAAGPSNYAKKRNVRDKENRHGGLSHGHAKGRSLGSLAGIMSFLSPGLSSPQQQPPGHIPSFHGGSHSTSDGEVLQALTKRVTPGNRRVLEPMSMDNDSLTSSLSQGAIAMHKRRVGSEAEIEGILKQRGNKTRSGGRMPVPEEDEEGVVEAMVSDTPTMSQRRLRPHLTVPLPSFPTWRFPIPSPPVTCLSPDIPLEAFTSPVENPLISAPPSRESSPVTKRNNSLLHPSGVEEQDEGEEEDQVEDDLSPTVSCSGSLSSTSSSRPSTPPKYDEDWATVRSLSPPDSIRTTRPEDDMGEMEGYLRPKLQRTFSQLSSDSKETIRPDGFREVWTWDKGGAHECDGDVTPKAARGRRGVASGIVA